MKDVLLSKLKLIDDLAAMSDNYAPKRVHMLIPTLRIKFANFVDNFDTIEDEMYLNLGDENNGDDRPKDIIAYNKDNRQLVIQTGNELFVLDITHNQVASNIKSFYEVIHGIKTVIKYLKALPDLTPNDYIDFRDRLAELTVDDLDKPITEVFVSSPKLQIVPYTYDTRPHLQDGLYAISMEAGVLPLNVADCLIFVIEDGYEKIYAMREANIEWGIHNNPLLNAIGNAPLSTERED